MWTSIRRRARSTTKGASSYVFGATIILSAVGIISFLVHSFTSLPTNLHLSQQCRMSRMWPSYKGYSIPSPSGLNAKYRLFVYREGDSRGVQSNAEPSGRPALFIPGNAGSFGQVRSVASSAHHLFQTGQGGPDISKEVDWWTVDFNEDFSAFHGQTMQEQAIYLNEVVAFLLKKYPTSKQVPVLGHSMGGVVARLMMVKENHPPNSVDTIITLSSPHAYPPVPLESGVEEVYRQINFEWEKQAKDTLLISLSGGILDDQLPSEPASLSLARIWYDNSSLSAFTSSLPALWSGVDHLAMMWCDQLRERVARGILRIEGRGKTVTERREEWRRMIGIEEGDRETRSILFSGETSSDSNPENHHQSMFRLSEADGEAFELITDLAVGLDTSFGPPIDQEAQIRVDLCSTDVGVDMVCRHVSPSAYDLLPPSPLPTESHTSMASFPRAEERYEIPGHGLRRLHLCLAQLGKERVNEIRVERRQTSPSGFVEAGWVKRAVLIKGHPSLGTTIKLPLSKGSSSRAPSFEVIAPNMGNSLLAYSLSMLPSKAPKTSCHSKLAPLLQIRSLSTGDTQYYPSVDSTSHFTLTLHSTSPFMPPSRGSHSGTAFTLYLDTCNQYEGISVNVDWTTSAGLLLSRYRIALGSFPLAVLLFITSHMWDEWDHGATFPALTISLLQYSSSLPALIVGSICISAAQSLADLLWSGDGLLSPSLQNLSFGIAASPLISSAALALVFLTAAYGLALMVSLLLDGMIAILAYVIRLTRLDIGFDGKSGNSEDVLHRPRSTLASFALLAVIIYLFVPFQFVFLVLFLLQILSTIRCSTAVRYHQKEGRELSQFHQQKLLLNLYFWLLPFTAPTLLIWTRNIIHGWYGTLGGSDHNFLSVLGFLLISQISSSGELLQRSRSRVTSIITQILMVMFSGYTLAYGIRYTYSLFHFVNMILIWLAVIHIQARYTSRRLAKDEGEENSEDQNEVRALLNGQDTLHSTVPEGLMSTEGLPQSIAASLRDEGGYKVGREEDHLEEVESLVREEKESKDDLLEQYLNLLDEYFACQKIISNHFSTGHFQLSKARMQLGKLTSLNRGWDARMKSQVVVTLSQNGSAVIEKKKRGNESVEGVLIDGEKGSSPEAIRRRKGAKDEKVEVATSDDATMKHKEKDIKSKLKKERKVQPFDPLYQFAALPPPSLRSAQGEFSNALEKLIGRSNERGLLAVQSELSHLERRIAARQ